MGTWRRPSCTPMVWPTKSGKMVESRDQVLSTFFSAPRFMVWTRASRRASTYGPFLTDLDIYLPVPRLRTIIFSVRLLRRVLWPRAGLPQGVWGWPPIGARPSPPPWGWSRGFITEPRTVGRLPSQRDRPAL